MARCCGCRRTPATCWVMPCLVLEVALAKGVRALNGWARNAGLRGVTFVKKEGK